MNCMKCGRETKEDAVFCEECLEHMDRHPVPPNTLAYVPSEKDRAAAEKKQITVAPVVTAEDQVKRLTRQLHVMILLVILLAGGLVFLALLSMDAFHEMDVARFMGKNYTAITSSATLN